MEGRRLLAASVVAVALVLSGCGGEDDAALKGMTREPPTKVGTVSLPDENPDNDLERAVLKGRGDGLMLVYFGYTMCPDVCPTTLADLRLALGELDSGTRRRVKVTMVTVDPRRDTAEVLNSYLGHFFPGWQYSSARTEDAAALRRVERPFGASHRIGKPDADGYYEVDHTAQLYAVDSAGTVVVEWPFGTPADDMASDLEQLLEAR
jgi:protein SCO1